MEFKLEGQEFIELNKLLKLLNLVETGGEAKLQVEQGNVKVNGEIEFRKRKKLRSGEVVEFERQEIRIIE